MITNKKKKLKYVALILCMIVLSFPITCGGAFKAIAATIQTEAARVTDVDVDETGAIDESTDSSSSNAKSPAMADGLFAESEVGFNGMYMRGKSVPVKIKLTNQLAKDLKGDLVLNIVDSNQTSVAHIMPLEIASGNTVEAVFRADGDFSKAGTWLQFYDGGVDRGKAVTISGSLYVEGNTLYSEHGIGISASHPDTLNFVAFLNNNGYNVTPIVLGDDFFAESHHDLSMFSILALNDIAASEWSELKIQAIQDWVASGGVLLVGGGAGYPQISEAFSDIVPVAGTQMMNWTNSELLQHYVASGEKLEPMPIIKGQFIRGEVLLQDAGIPILAQYAYGNGKVIYTAFDLGLKPFANWDGRTALVENLLNERLISPGRSSNYEQWWGLDNSSSYFPRLQSPQVGSFLIIFAIYTLIVAPILYLVLRRFDRREWSWWIIPSLAVISTAVIMMLGTRDKSDIYVNAIKIANVKQDVVQEWAVNKVFIPNNKDITLEVSDRANIRINGQDSNRYAEVNTNKQNRIYYNGETTEVKFTNNKYWTTKSVMLEDQLYSTEKYGTILTDFEQSDGQSRLRITNQTGQDVEHLSLIFNGQLYYIGELVADEQTVYDLPSSVSLDSLLVQNNRRGYYRNPYGSMLSSASGVNWDNLQREQSLLDYGAYVNHFASLIGFSYSRDEQYVINDKLVKSDEMTMWHVDIEHLMRHELQLEEVISPTNISLLEGGSFRLDEQQYIMLHEEGSLLLKYRIPDIKADGSGQLIGQIVPDINAQHFAAKLSIYNEKEDEWELISDEKFDLTPYLSSFQFVLLKLETTQDYFEGKAPLLLLDREVQ